MFYYWIVNADTLFRNMGFDNFGQTILVKCALLGDAAVGKTAISQALGAFFSWNFFIQRSRLNLANISFSNDFILQYLMVHNSQRIIQWPHR